MDIRRFLYLPVLICVAVQVLGSCTDAGKSNGLPSDGTSSSAATKLAVTKAKLLPSVEYEISRSGLLRVSSNRAFDSRYEGLLSDTPKEEYTEWNMEAGSSLDTTGIDPPQRGTRFAQLLVEFVNVGASTARLNVSPSDGKGLDLALVLPSGKEMEAWEFLGSEWFPDYGSIEEHLARHGDEIAVQVSFEGKLYCDLEPGQRSWLALLFTLPSSEGDDLARLKLRVKDTSVDVPRISD